MKNPHPSPTLYGRTGLALLASFAIHQICYADNPQAPSLLDWHPREQLSPEQQQSIATGCCGAYVDPMTTTAPLTSKDATTENVNISGEQSHITKNSTLMIGNVELIQGDRKLTGDTAELFNDPRSVKLEGHVTYREPGFLLEGNKASVNLEQNEISIENARYVLHEQHIHGEAEHIQRSEHGVIYLTESTYTTCEPADPLWKLRSQSMTLDTEQGQGTVSHVRLEVNDIPVFYFPYMRFPINDQRQSGFLVPSFTSGEDGLDIAVPYYFNLAPDYDLTLIPRHISDRGTQLGGEFRHLSRHFNSVASAALLPDDKLANEDRWLAAFDQRGGARQPWSTTVDFARVSDEDYFEDLSAIGLSVSQQTHLKQAGSAGYMTDHWDNKVEVESFQTLRNNSNIDDPYEKLPELSAKGAYFLNDGFHVKLAQQIARFDHADPSQVTGDRLSADYQFGWRNKDQAFYIEPALNLHYRGQQLDNNIADDSPEAVVPGFTFDTGLILEKTSQHHYHTLEPRFFYAYTDYENQDNFQLFDTDEIDFTYKQLYDNRRLAGDDRVADNNQSSVGAIYHLSSLADHSEFMSFGIGQIFYHDDRRVNGFDTITYALLPPEYRERYTSTRSPIAAQWAWLLNSHWRIDSDLAWDEQKNKTHQSSIFLHYQSIGNALFSIGYRHKELLTQLDPAIYIMETVRQGDLSGHWPLNNQWAMMGGLRYDFTHQRALENMVGLQYEDCCWRLRTLYRQWETNPEEVFNTALHEQDQGLYIEIQFKGLASTGKKIPALLENNVYGYQSND